MSDKRAFIFLSIVTLALFAGIVLVHANGQGWWAAIAAQVAG